MDPVTDPIFKKFHGIAGNRTRDLLDDRLANHYTKEAVIFALYFSLFGFATCVHHRPGLNSKPFRSMYVEKAYSTVDSDSSVGWGR